MNKSMHLSVNTADLRKAYNSQQTFSLTDLAKIIPCKRSWLEYLVSSGKVQRASQVTGRVRWRSLYHLYDILDCVDQAQAFESDWQLRVRKPDSKRKGERYIVKEPAVREPKPKATRPKQIKQEVKREVIVPARAPKQKTDTYNQAEIEFRNMIARLELKKLRKEAQNGGSQG